MSNGLSFKSYWCLACEIFYKQIVNEEVVITISVAEYACIQ